MLPLSSDIMLKELEGIREIVTKWYDLLKSGLPEIENPESEISLFDFVTKLSGELALCAGKCQNVSSVLDGCLNS